MSGRRHSVDRSFDGLYRFDGHAELERDGPPLPFHVSLPVLVGNGNRGWRVGTAFSSVRKIISVCFLFTLCGRLRPRSSVNKVNACVIPRFLSLIWLALYKHVLFIYSIET